ncbi:MAG: OmpH family outer membrane protein [Myxococcales bacterium]|nr:OmpH family outer membrane protein [Myxococcales bacterium]MDH3484313.1 OmpH family outer membrane protein [Myxococcales bacterium]
MGFCRIVVLALATFVLANAASTADAQVKIGVVDLQRAINETEDGRQAKRRLTKLFEERQKKLDAAQNSLKSQKENIERQQDVLSEDALKKKVGKYQEDLMALQTEYVDYQRELSTKEAELTKKILDKMQGILRRIGQTDGYTLIVEANEGGVVWVPSNLDLTDVLIQRYNAQAKKSGGGKKK